MKILKSTDNLTMKQMYDLTRNPETERMSNHVGESIDVVAYMVREEEKGDTGEVVTITSILTGTGTIFATNSATFAREFCGMLELAAECGEAVHRIYITQGVSKKGREYVTCVLEG